MSDKLSEEQRVLIKRIMDEALVPFMNAMKGMGMPKEKIAEITIDVVKAGLALAKKYSK